MFYLGIDGGGTNTRACIINEKLEVVGTGKSGASSVDTVTSEVTRRSIIQAVKSAVETYGTDIACFDGVMAGIGGIVHDSDRQGVVDAVYSSGICTDRNMISVENDMKIALAGGNILEPGISVIIGTGSVAYGRNAAGAEMKTGGWGYKEGDPGSSYDLGISAIRALVRAYDGREKITGFTEKLFVYLNLSSINDITELLYRKNMSRTEIAALAPIVTEFANKSDIKAVEIVERSTDELAHMVNTIYGRIFKPDDNINVVIIGSLGNSGGIFKDLFSSKIKNFSINMNVIPGKLEPVVGAALWAAENAGQAIDRNYIVENIQKFQI